MASAVVLPLWVGPITARDCPGSTATTVLVDLPRGPASRPRTRRVPVPGSPGPASRSAPSSAGRERGTSNGPRSRRVAQRDPTDLPGPLERRWGPGRPGGKGLRIPPDRRLPRSPGRPSRRTALPGRSHRVQPRHHSVPFVGPVRGDRPRHPGSRRLADPVAPSAPRATSAAPIPSADSVMCGSPTRRQPVHMAASVSTSDCSSGPSTCWTRKARGPTFHRATPRRSWGRRSASVGERDRSSAAWWTSPGGWE